MFDALRERWKLGRPVIRDISQAKLPAAFRGAPLIRPELCPPDCHECVEACPTNAIELSPLRLDLGKCIFCPACAEACPTDAVQFTPEYRMGSLTREGLQVRGSQGMAGTVASMDNRGPDTLRRLFGRSLKLRSISAGGCNGCELELNALSNVNFDMSRFGIEFVASPRHADGIVISGPIPAAMSSAVFATFDAVPAPKIVVAFGACSISGGIFQDSPELDREFLKRFRVDLFVPGCPPHPLTFLWAVLDFLGRRPEQK